MSIDARREIRVPLELPIKYGDFDKGTYQSLTKDLSTRGACIQSKAPFDVGTRCRLLFALPHQEEKIEITGEVRWKAFTMFLSSYSLWRLRCKQVFGG